jgi:hypothetical protein
MIELLKDLTSPCEQVQQIAVLHNRSTCYQMGEPVGSPPVSCLPKPLCPRGVGKRRENEWAATAASGNWGDGGRSAIRRLGPSRAAAASWFCYICQKLPFF